MVSATIPETKTAPARVKANSRNKDPVRPPCSPIGRYTAARVMVMEMTGPTSSRAPLSAASNGARPLAMWRSTFSTMTIASSTTRPTHKTMASKVRRFTVKPKACMRKMAPRMDSGMATTGTSTARTEPRKRNMTTTTMSSVSASVLSTSVMAPVM